MPNPQPVWTRREALRALAAVGAGMALSLGGCARGRRGGVPLSLWHIWEREKYAPMEAVLSRYAARNGAVTIEDLPISSNYLRWKLESAATVDALPDVFLVNSSWLEYLGGAQNLADLGALAARAGIEPSKLLRHSDYGRCIHGGRLLCLPACSASGTAMLFTNQKLLADLGLPVSGRRFANWREFTEGSRELVARANPNGRLEWIALDPFMDPGIVIHSALAAGLGTPPVGADGRTAQLDSPASLRVGEALDRYVDEVYGSYGGYRALLRWRMRYWRQSRSSTFASVPYDRQFYAIASAGSLALYQKLMTPLQVGVQPVPGLERLHGGVLTHSWSYCLSRRSPWQAEAWALLRYLTLEEDGAGLFCRSFVRPSALLSTKDEDFRREVGAVWDDVLEAASLDISHPASIQDEFLRNPVYCIPMRRLKGESMEFILTDINGQLRDFIGGSPAWGV